MGILANVLELGPPPGLFMLTASFFSVIVVLTGVGGVLLVIWYLLIARRLFQLAQARAKEEAKQPAVS